MNRSSYVAGLLIMLALIGGTLLWMAARWGIWPGAPVVLRGPWVMQSTRSCAAAGNLWQYEFAFARGKEHTECHLLCFKGADVELMVLDNGSARTKPRYSNLAAALRENGCSAGTNGGFFDVGSFTPNGLMIANGEATGVFDHRNWADGVLLVQGPAISLQTRVGFMLVPGVTQLLQTGPWLVREGHPQQGFAGDVTAYCRTFVATDGQGRWALGHLNAGTLTDLARLLAHPEIRKVLGVQDALNLEGGRSSAYGANLADGTRLYYPERTVVRNFIGVRPRKPPLVE